jgi:hypothetical protein
LPIFAGCSVSSKNFPERDKLKREIINNIIIPVNISDTIIYKSHIGYCGNSSEDEINRRFVPELNEQPYFELLKARINKTIICTGDSSFYLLDKSPEKRKEIATAWKNLSKNKCTLTISGDAVTNSSVTIHESYDYNKKVVVIEKLFTHTWNNWQCKKISQFEYATN